MKLTIGLGDCRTSNLRTYLALLLLFASINAPMRTVNINVSSIDYNFKKHFNVSVKVVIILKTLKLVFILLSYWMRGKLFSIELL